MIRIAIIGGIVSGKTFISKLFGYPVFNADTSVANIYSKDRNVYLELKKILPEFFSSFPVKKKQLIRAILKNKDNLQKISSIVHPAVRKNLKIFIKKNKKSKMVILDIPLFLENKLNKKNDIIIFVQSDQTKILKRLKKRKNFNKLIFNKLKKAQLPLSKKRAKCHYVIKNNFNIKLVNKRVKEILRSISL